MEELEVNIISLFVVAEVALLLLVVAVVFFIRGRIMADRVRRLQSELKKAKDVPEPVGFDQYLRDEVVRNQGLIDQAAASEDDAEKKAAELLTLRKRFLELELEAFTLADNPVQFQDKLSAGVSELLEEFRPEAETVAVPINDADVTEAGLLEAADEDAAADSRTTLDTHNEEFNRLKQVINNQQDAMAALRTELQAREADIQDLDSILRKLDEFERHDAELQQCLAVLDEENQRLKAATEAGGSGASIEKMDSAQLTGLKNMIGNQELTISNLQQLIRELAPEASKAAELEDAINNVQRANQELNGCIAVLEDENAMLRAELDAVNAQLEAEAEEQANSSEEPDLVAFSEDEAPEALSPDDEKQELEVKVQELEALVEFKDAAIEELEKQYNTLESKYLALTGEKKVE
jgi:chromosome segregation ATPase